MATSWTVVIGPSSGILGFRRRLMVWSLGFNRIPFASSGRSLSAVPFCPVDDCDDSASTIFCPAPIESLSLAAGNSWYLRGSVGWCILHTYFSESSLMGTSVACIIFSDLVRRRCWPNILLMLLHEENVVIALLLYNCSTPSCLVDPPVNPQYEPCGCFKATSLACPVDSTKVMGRKVRRLCTQN